MARRAFDAFTLQNAYKNSHKMKTATKAAVLTDDSSIDGKDLNSDHWVMSW